MSLDVTLIKRASPCPTCGRGNEDEYLYDANITHNLHQMANEAGVGQYLWAPEEVTTGKAGDLIAPLTSGIAKMRQDPDRFRQFEPENKWGTYDDFLPWLEQLLEACKDYPDAELSVSR